MSAVVDSERKGHKRKLADTFTYSNVVAGHTGGEKDSVPAHVLYDSFACSFDPAVESVQIPNQLLVGETTAWCHQRMHTEVPRQCGPCGAAKSCSQLSRAQQVRYMTRAALAAQE